MRYFVLTILILGSLFIVVIGSQAATGVSAPQASIQKIIDVSQIDESSPVTVPEPSARAISCYHSNIVLWTVSIILGLLIPGAILFSGLSARLRDLSARIGRKWFFIIAVYFIIFSVISHILNLPLSFYWGYILQHAYGLSNQTLSKWLSDYAKSMSVYLVGGVMFLWIPYLLIMKSPKRWWLFTGLLSFPILIFVMFVVPVWVNPLFNEIGPMKDKMLEAKIVNLAERVGIEGCNIYEEEKSADTNTFNAYFTGVGKTKRIVIWDTAIDRLNEHELMALFGHEMGHYVLGHVWKTILLCSVLIIISLFAVDRTALWLTGKSKRRFGFESLSDIASLPLFILLVNLSYFIVSPAAFAYSRCNEHESDRFALELTHFNHSWATMLSKASRDALIIPRGNLITRIWWGDHPELGDRIDFSNSYSPWKKGEPIKYGRLFREK